MKNDLYDITNIVLDLIKKGDDFIVVSTEFGKLARIPILKEDVKPHIQDFRKADASDDLIAFYFAYLICSPNYDVYSKNKERYLQAEVKPTIFDEHLASLFEYKFLDEAQKCKEKRLAKAKEENIM